MCQACLWCDVTSGACHVIFSSSPRITMIVVISGDMLLDVSLRGSQLYVALQP